MSSGRSQRVAQEITAEPASSCELCGKALGPESEFGDVDGAIVCGKCMGWEGDKPDPEVVEFLKRNDEWDDVPDKKPVWPPRTSHRENPGPPEKEGCSSCGTTEEELYKGYCADCFRNQVNKSGQESQ